MEDKPSIRKNFAFSTLYQIILILVSFISASYLSRVLGADMIRSEERRVGKEC